MSKAHAYFPPEKVQTTPSGIEIRFFDKHVKTEDSPGQRRFYEVDGEQPVAVTTILGLLDKPALQSWAHKVGIKGAIELARDGGLPQDVDAAIGAMIRRDLCYWQIRDAAAGRGQLPHDEAVRLGAGEPADLSRYPEELQGFVMGVCGWYADFRPRVLHQELMVASPFDGYAGRLDLVAEFRTPEYSGVGLVDYKSVEKLPRDKRGRVRPPYREHALQLAAYERAYDVCGYEPPIDFSLIVRVDSSGSYDVTRGWATAEDFLAVASCYRQLKGLDGRTPAAVAA